ncbi:MAG TPA: hypothetical protein VLE02_00980 [Nitrosarchaeum sp.]|nr:hypothetical protein [Nitrosarchaeum sp.]
MSKKTQPKVFLKVKNEKENDSSIDAELDAEIKNLEERLKYLRREKSKRNPTEKSDDTSVDKLVLKFLKENEGEHKPQHIAKSLGLKPCTSSSVNPSLYRLLKEDKVSKKCEEGGANPRWSYK